MFKYIGKGSALPGIPARDLSDDEAQRYGVRNLLASKLYVKIKEKPAPKENKRSQKEYEQKD